MLSKTKGLVLGVINYNDKYSLVHMYTRDFGRVTYFLSKKTSKSSKVNKKIFQPLALLSLEVSHTPNRDIHQIKEAQTLFFTHNILTDLSKTSMAFFISEFLSKTLNDNQADQHLFDFLVNAVEVLEMNEKSIANYHLVFLLKLSYFFGFTPNFHTYEEGYYFDMINGEFVSRQPLHNKYISVGESFYLHKFSHITFQNMSLYKFNRKDRNRFVEYLLDYYRLHLHDFPELKTLEVLQQLFD